MSKSLSIRVPLWLTGLSALLLSACIDQLHVQDPDKLALTEHPLVDKIWDVRKARFITRETLQGELLKAKYLLFGETHDNRLHHQHQAELIRFLVGAGKRPSVHFEMINDAQFERVDAKALRSSDTLIAALGPEHSGWDYEGMYRVVFDEVLAAKLELLPANIDRQALRAIIRQGEGSVPDSLREVLNGVSLPQAQQQGMANEIREGHCNALPEDMVAPMVLGQQVRDARMGLSLVQSRAAQRVLISGSGHARRDRGAPLYVTREDAGASLLALGFIEVLDEQFAAQDYAARWGGEHLPFDYVWFTPRHDRSDPCQGFAEHMKNK